MSDTLVKVENVSKKYCRSLKKSLWYGMLDLGHELTGSRRDDYLRSDEFWAVREVNFELKRGECLGLIGHNGAGKTTMLKMLNGLIKPDTGSINIRGRVCALIALGAGFNPILTGRENICVNASVLGLSKFEITQKFDEIVEFAEMGEFINAPVQTYSSGMIVRLGFAIATALKPDILLLDEVLAVGDVAFQIKCGNRIRELVSESAVIFVSHNMQYVSTFCSRAMLFGGGRVVVDSLDPGPAIQQYLDQARIPEQVTGTGGVRVNLLSFQFADDRALAEPNEVDQGAELTLRLKVTVAQELEDIKLSLAIMDAARSGVVSLPIVGEEGMDARFAPGDYDLKIPLGRIELNAGNYSLMVVAQEYESERHVLRHEGATFFKVRAPNMKSVAKIIRPVQVRAVSD